MPNLDFAEDFYNNANLNSNGLAPAVQKKTSRCLTQKFELVSIQGLMYNEFIRY
jgi:hypothetical protein